MQKNEILKLVKNHINEMVLSFSVNILDHEFIIRDKNAENLGKIKKLFFEYIHLQEEREVSKFTFYINNIQNSFFVEKFYELKETLGKGKKIQTFKDDTFHETFSLCQGEVELFYPQECNNYLILKFKETYFFICKKNMNSHLLRIVREIFFRNSENQDNVVYHGGGFEISKNGVMVCGDKSKGKTTVILESLKKGASYLANDRIIISKDDRMYNIKYLPMSMRIGLGTISHTPCLAEKIKTYSWSRKQSTKVLSYSYNQKKAISEFGGTEKLEVTSREIQDIFKVNLIEKSPLKAIVFPEIDLDFRGMEILPCEPDVAYKMVLEQCMTPHDENWVSPWIFPRIKTCEELKRYAEEFSYDLVQSVKTYIVHFGPDAYQKWNMDLF